MINQKIAKRYAQALLQIGEDQKKVNELYEELLQFNELLLADQHIAGFWYDEKTSADLKVKALKAALKGQFSEIVINFLCVVMSKNREAILADILEAYKHYADELNNIIYAEVTSAVELNEDAASALQDSLSKKTGKNVRLTIEINPKIMGGLIVKIGDQVYDGSVTKRLEAMKNSLKEVRV